MSFQSPQKINECSVNENLITSMTLIGLSNKNVLNIKYTSCSGVSSYRLKKKYNIGEVSMLHHYFMILYDMITLCHLSEYECIYEETSRRNTVKQSTELLKLHCNQ